jgi:hypothetical protein
LAVAVIAPALHAAGRRDPATVATSRVHASERARWGTRLAFFIPTPALHTARRRDAAVVGPTSTHLANVPDGGLDWPAQELPQHSTLPDAMTPQVCPPPALTVIHSMAVSSSSLLPHPTAKGIINNDISARRMCPPRHRVYTNNGWGWLRWRQTSSAGSTATTSGSVLSISRSSFSAFS